MKTFKQYFTEATNPPLDNWKKVVKDNKMLATGLRLVRQIEKLGGEALIVGGAVRDIILDKPIKDIDIATNVPISTLKQNFKWNEIGLSGKLGIIQIHFGGEEFEVANYRSETGTSDSRHPDKVTFVNSFKDDSARRDITINSMGMNSKGEIIDYQGGLDDLKNKIIKSVGVPKERFKEDATRLLRVFRFASRYGFDIEDATLGDLEALVDDINDIKPEAIMKELEKIASNGSKLASYIKYLDKSGYLERILPEVKALQGMKQNPIHHPEGDAYEHTMAALEHSQSDDPATNLAILFHDLGKGMGSTGEKNGHPTYHGHDALSAQMAEEIGKRLKFKNETINAIIFAATNHMKFHHLEDMSNKKILGLANSPYWEVLKAVAYADNFSRDWAADEAVEKRFADRIKHAEKIAKEFSGISGAEGERLRIKAMINGQEVKDWTGLPQGPEMGQILKLTQDWAYNNIDATKDEIKQFVLDTYREMRANQNSSLEERYDILIRRSHE